MSTRRPAALLVLAAALLGTSGGVATAQDAGPLTVTDTRPYACSDDSGTQREYQAQVTQTLTAPGAVGPGGQFAVTDVIDTLALDESGGLSVRLDDPVGVGRSTGTVSLPFDSADGQLEAQAATALPTQPLADKRTEPGVVLRGLASERSTPIPVGAGQGVYLAHVIDLALQLQAADGSTTTRTVSCAADSVFDAPALVVPAVPGAPAGTADEPVLVAGAGIAAAGAAGTGPGGAGSAAAAAGAPSGTTPGTAGAGTEPGGTAGRPSADGAAGTSGTASVLTWLGAGAAVVVALLAARAWQVRRRRAVR